ncbi:molybdopterin molybdenumtransferase MoeA [Halovenus sp. WSH3]|uniref:Molybdopterin molybdenumtransferase MoeA n=1 Tax=Halovenus carboxidivorans TaxID=2692199 RepID=A0A6B0T3G5_9EURY|nr:molybdopterin molybdotransferase MoeA [Halovenus carboxidivorans]MXR52818.1 molybdopterin molybdenumtransferase MoeA [Halovenus carboxidivorans]
MSHDHDDMVWRSDAVDRLLDLRETVLADQPTEEVALAGAAGRTLASGIVAQQDRPPVSRSTMDGYAFDATDGYPLDLREEEVFPEDDPPSIDDGEAVRIFTGAPLPPEANAVLKQEEATVEDGRLDGSDIDPGTYVYERGSNLAAGEQLFAAGERLSPKDALLLGDLGYDEVTVHERFDAALLATGTEIHEGRQRDLDSPMLAGLLRSWGHRPTHEGTVPDEYDRVRDRIDALAGEYDAVVTTGGTSVGDKDHVVRALEDLGDVLFHRVRIRPGKPIAVARLPDHDAVAVAIPGKPVGAHVITTLVARALFVGPSELATVSATLSTDLGLGPEGFEYVVPVTLDDGEATPLGHVDSALSIYEEAFDPSVLSSSTRASRADGFLVTETERAAGETVEIVPYPVVE